MSKKEISDAYLMSVSPAGFQSSREHLERRCMEVVVGQPERPAWIGLNFSEVGHTQSDQPIVPERMAFD